MSTPDIANSILDFLVPRQYVDGAQIPCRLLDEQCLRLAHRMGAVFSEIQAKTPTLIHI